MLCLQYYLYCFYIFIWSDLYFGLQCEYMIFILSGNLYFGYWVFIFVIVLYYIEFINYCVFELYFWCYCILLWVWIYSILFLFYICLLWFLLKYVSVLSDFCYKMDCFVSDIVLNCILFVYFYCYIDLYCIYIHWKF